MTTRTQATPEQIGNARRVRVFGPRQTCVHCGASIGPGQWCYLEAAGGARRFGHILCTLRANAAGVTLPPYQATQMEADDCPEAYTKGLWYFDRAGPGWRWTTGPFNTQAEAQAEANKPRSPTDE